MITLGPVSAWLVWGVLALAGCGLWAVLWQAGQLAGYLAERWRDRGESLSEEEPDGYDIWGREPGHEDYGLPPERSWEQMTSHQLPVFDTQKPEFWTPENQALLDQAAPERERRAPWWEADHRAAYQSLGLDYPSGLLARVRELTP